MNPLSVARIGAAFWLISIVLPLASLFRHPAVPAAAELLAVLLAAIACARPAWGLACGAALIPLSVTIGALLHLPFSFAEPMALAIAAGCAIRYLARPQPVLAVEAPMLAWPALLALVVAASAAVQCMVAAAFYPSGTALAGEIWGVLTVRYFTSVGRFDGLRDAMVMIEGLALLTATVVAADGPRRRVLLLRSVLVGGAGVAAQNLLRLSEIALRSGDFWGTAARELVSARISAAFADVNTAGSYLVMVLAIAIAWAWYRRSALATAIAPLLAVGLWISGSRTAMAAGVLGVPLAMLRGWRRWWLGAGFLIVAIAVLWGAQRIRTTNNPSFALFVRVEMLKAGSGMLRESPIFGVGIGRFYETSERFISPELARYYVRENAHNQFLQIAAELGIAGLLVFLALIYTALARRTTETSAPIRQACLAGLVTFLLTCAGGHPLLVKEVALSFWLLTGLALAAGRVPAEAPATGHRGWWWAGTAAVAAVMLLTLPVRVRAAASALNLEHVAVGASMWQHAEDGTRYRRMGRRATFYVPAPATPLRFRIRVSPAGHVREPISVMLTLDGEPANEIVVSPGSWQPVKLLIPADGSRKFRALELTVREPTAAEGPYLDVTRMRAGP